MNESTALWKPASVTGSEQRTALMVRGHPTEATYLDLLEGKLHQMALSSEDLEHLVVQFPALEGVLQENVAAALVESGEIQAMANQIDWEAEPEEAEPEQEGWARSYQDQDLEQVISAATARRV